LALACFAVAPSARAVVPAPDGGYPGDNTAAALPLFDRIYQQSLRAMQTEARAVELRIDTDIDVVVDATSHFLLATIDGFEDIVLEYGLNEFDWGFANVAGFKGLPDDYYRVHAVIDLRTPEEAVTSFINSRGEVFTFPLVLKDDPHPELGPRKIITSEGSAVESGISILNRYTYVRNNPATLTDRTGYSVLKNGEPAASGIRNDFAHHVEGPSFSAGGIVTMR
jgi:hypothetical protein